MWLHCQFTCALNASSHRHITWHAGLYQMRHSFQQFFFNIVQALNGIISGGIIACLNVLKIFSDKDVSKSESKDKNLKKNYAKVMALN